VREADPETKGGASSKSQSESEEDE
jgi:hypothetical protein